MGSKETLHQLAAAVAGAVQAKYMALPKTGKPQLHEHTILAGIVAYTVNDHADSQDRSHSTILSSSQPRPMHVVALGTGTKCLGGGQRSAAGDLLNDSHAEVIARRAFVAWIVDQLQHAGQQTEVLQCPGGRLAPHQCHVHGNQQGATQCPAVESQSTSWSAFQWCCETKRYQLLPGVRFAMYISQPPCGDASIFQQTTHCCSDTFTPRPSGSATTNAAQQRVGGRTGAKVLRPASAADVAEALAATAAEASLAVHDPQPTLPAAATAAAPFPHAEHTDMSGGCMAPHVQQPGPFMQQQKHSMSMPTAHDVEAGPQQLGVLRRKPGKGDPTLSLSCSDKISRWVCLGLQGCLLTALLQEPIYLSMLVVSVPGQQTDRGLSAQEPQHSTASVECGAPHSQQTAGSNSVSNSSVLAAVESACLRAFCERLAGCAEVLEAPFQCVPPQVVAVGAPGPDLRLQALGGDTAASGTSINWSCDLPLLTALHKAKAGGHTSPGTHEVTSAAFGRKAGAARKGPAATSIKTRSRLSPAAMFERWQEQQRIAGVSGQQQSAACCASAPVPVDSGQARYAQLYKEARELHGAQYLASWGKLRCQGLLFSHWPWPKRIAEPSSSC